jgi:acyl-CoA dehydrogenase family protein 9
MSNTRLFSFGKSLFFGALPEDVIFPYPRLSRQEQERTAKLLTQLSELSREAIDPRQIDEQEQIPSVVLQRLAALGVMGLNIPAQYGGQALSMTAACRVLDAVGSIDGSLAVTLGAHLGLCAGAVAQFGSESQRQLYLPRLASGQVLGSFASSEPTSGSDTAAIRTRARQDGEEFVLNGSKLWVQNGGLAHLHVLFAQTQVVREGQHVDRITGFIAESGPGLRPGCEEKKLGLRGSSTTALYLEDLRLPRAQILGGLGGGQKVAMDTHNRGRLLFAAGCIGSARELMRLAVQHATSRRQFGRLISTLGMIKDKIARMAIDLYAAESMLYLTTGLMDLYDHRHRGRESADLDYSLESACCKVVASEMLGRVAHHAMQVAAGCGYRRDYPYERLLRDSRAFQIFPGTNEVLRCYIALLGLAAPGEQLDKLSDAIKYPLRGYGLVVDTLLEKVRTAAYGRTQLTRHHPRLKKEAVYIEDAAEALTQAVDRVLRRHGRQISEMQYVQKRVADVVIDLLAMCATVSRASAALTERDLRHARGGAGLTEAAGQLDSAERELRLCAGFCGKASVRIRDTLARFVQNDDELMKTIADDCYVGRPYPLDAVL